MLEFHEIKIEDGIWARPLLEQSNRQACGYSFANLFTWSQIYRTMITRFEDMVIVKCTLPDDVPGSPYLYLFPAGRGDKKAAVREILQDASTKGRLPRFYSLTEEDKLWMEETYPDIFTFSANRAEWDYLYEVQDLQNLPGKKYQKKRNHVSRFLREHPDYQFEAITPKNIEEIKEFNRQWVHLYENEQDIGILREHTAVNLGLEYFEELKLVGGLIRVDGKIVAFTYGSKISDTVFDTHVEKALYDMNGAYNIINREFARTFLSEYQYINREDDTGDEGLRQAKLSYQPAVLLEKYCADIAGGETVCFELPEEVTLPL